GSIPARLLSHLQVLTQELSRAVHLLRETPE
ncbi:unnamed protein product, partial [marine sediment metagenome]